VTKESTVPIREAQITSERLIGTGLTSEVFSWGEARVLKLFLPWVATETIHAELSITQAIHAAGVAVPAAFELVKVGQRLGIVFERISGRSLLKQVEARPWTLFAAARQLAELHGQVHTHDAPDQLPKQHQQVEQWIEAADDFTESQKWVAREHLALLPASGSLCHGDFHPGNIILTSRGPMIIDWAWATRGHPVADVARTSVLFESADLPPTTPFHVRFLMLVARKLLHFAYLRRYMELRYCTMEEIERWRVPQRMAGSAWRAGKRGAMAKLETRTES
jgi:uncharacterized protein (TIGR02172 family)